MTVPPACATDADRTGFGKAQVTGVERRYGAVTMTTEDALRRAGRPRAAVAIAAAAWGCAVLAVVLVVVARPPLGEGLWFFAVDVAVACVYGTVAALVLSRRPHPVGWILGLAAVGGGVAALGFGYPELAAQRPGLPLADVVQWLQSTAWVPGTLALFLVVPWLVRDHPLGRARWGVLTGVLVATSEQTSYPPYSPADAVAFTLTVSVPTP